MPRQGFAGGGEILGITDGLPNPSNGYCGAYWDIQFLGVNSSLWVEGGDYNSSYPRAYIFDKLASGAWYQIALSYAGSTDTEELYVNGAQIGTKTVVAPLSSGLFDYETTCATVNPYSSIQAHFNGKLADMQIYNKTLTSAQINRLYSEGFGGGPITNVSCRSFFRLLRFL